MTQLSFMCNLNSTFSLRTLKISYSLIFGKTFFTNSDYFQVEVLSYVLVEWSFAPVGNASSGCRLEPDAVRLAPFLSMKKIFIGQLSDRYNLARSHNISSLDL